MQQYPSNILAVTKILCHPRACRELVGERGFAVEDLALRLRCSIRVSDGLHPWFPYHVVSVRSSNMATLIKVVEIVRSLNRNLAHDRDCIMLFSVDACRRIFSGLRMLSEKNNLLISCMKRRFIQDCQERWIIIGGGEFNDIGRCVECLLRDSAYFTPMTYIVRYGDFPSRHSERATVRQAAHTFGRNLDTHPAGRVRGDRENVNPNTGNNQNMQRRDVYKNKARRRNNAQPNRNNRQMTRGNTGENRNEPALRTQTVKNETPSVQKNKVETKEPVVTKPGPVQPTQHDTEQRVEDQVIKIVNSNVSAASSTVPFSPCSTTFVRKLSEFEKTPTTPEEGELFARDFISLRTSTPKIPRRPGGGGISQRMKMKPVMRDAQTNTSPYEKLSRDNKGNITANSLLLPPALIPISEVRKMMKNK